MSEAKGEIGRKKMSFSDRIRLRFYFEIQEVCLLLRVEIWLFIGGGVCALLGEIDVYDYRRKHFKIKSHFNSLISFRCL